MKQWKVSKTNKQMRKSTCKHKITNIVLDVEVMNILKDLLIKLCRLNYENSIQRYQI